MPKRLVALVLGGAFALSVLAACDGAAAPNGTAGDTGKPMPTLVYYTIGVPDPDLAEVNDRLNTLLAEKIGVQVDYRKINWGEYENRLNVLINSGQSFDIAFAINYAPHAKRGAWLRLDEYLAEGAVGRGMYEAVDPVFWEGVTIGGGIYGVPTNKELAVIEQWMYPRELVEKYGIDIEAYRTLEALEPLFALIAENEPEYLVMELDSYSHNFFALDGYEYIYDKTLPLMVRSLDEVPVVVNPFATEEGRRTLDTLRRYFLAGYINEDAALVPPTNLAPEKKVFFKVASGGPYSAPIWSAQRKYPVVACMVSDPIVTTESTQGGVMSVSASTDRAEACVAFLNCLNTDPEVRNLLNYGIEGLHYTLDAAGQVIELNEEGYSGVQYTQGNWFILKTRGGDEAEPLDKWEQYKQYNASTVKSNILGFVPDMTAVSTQLEAVTGVWGSYYPALMTGSVEVEVFLPDFLAALAEAGLEEIRAEMQQQLDSWWAQNKA